MCEPVDFCCLLLYYRPTPLTIIMDIIKQYIHDVRSEVAKVNWPTRKEVVFLSGVIILASVLVALVLGGLDVVFQKLLQQILPL